MKLEKIITKLEEHVVSVAEDNYDMGYFDGHIDGHSEGIAEERKRVIDLFKMLSQQELASGSAAKAKAYAMAADMVDVANRMQDIDWSEDGLEAWNQEDNEKNGF